ncbi:armadillo repeat-containing protein 3-like isoform X1 [Sycon ciliatum]|uniref:armadillo repeat-containing protein 3-like isoform X1 n=2 Tax=Sycon ciliatum TaxID=27933 RepID=UPI0031F6A95D
MSKAKKKGATPAVPKEPEEQPLASVTVTLTDCDGLKLILQSPEAAATASACKHLFEHAEKGNKEKLFLLNNDMHIELIKHSLTHSDKATRYYAVMCLGSMAQCPEVLEKLARNEDFHAVLVPMCNTTEGLACQQHSSYLISRIASIHPYFAGMMWKHGAVPAIVPLLASTDNDIKKNAIIGLAALASDAEARTSLLEESTTVPTVLEYLYSEYRDFQINALDAVRNLTGSAEFREQLRQNNAFDKLLGIFREKSFEDLHTRVLDTMAGMMKDRESFEMMFDNGDTKKVLSVLEEAITKAEVPVCSVVLKFLSALVHQDPTFSSKLYDMNIVAVCYGLLINESEDVVAKACSLIGALSRYSLLCSEKFVDQDDFYQHILTHMECETTAMREAASYAFVYVLKSKANCKVFMEKTGNSTGIEVLCRCIQQTSLLAQKNSLNAVLQILSHHEPSWDAELLENSFVEALLTVLGSGDRLCAVRKHIGKHYHSPHTTYLTAHRLHKDLYFEYSLLARKSRLGLASLNHLTSRIGMTKPPPPAEEVPVENPYKKRLETLPHDCDPKVRKMLEIRAQSMMLVPRELMVASAACLGHFMTYPAGRQRLMDHEKSVEILTRNLCQCHGEERRQERFVLCQAIRHACLDCDVAQAFTEAGGLTELHNVLASLPAAVREFSLATSCITTVLDHNPTMLYWMTGSLKCSHVTQTGFYVLAQYKPVKASVKQALPSLQELGVAKRSNAFTAYYFYPVQPEPVKPPTPAPEAGQDTPKERSNSKLGKPIKKTKKAEKEQAAKDELGDLKESTPSPGLVWTPNPDYDLWTMIEDVSQTIMRSTKLPSANLKVRELAVYVSERMGGAFSELDIRQGKILHLDHIAELKMKLNSNIIPLGMIRCGTFLHRALLFKVLADRLYLPCTLHRGAGLTAWNTFQCIDVHHREQVVDLMYKPGALLDLHTPEAERYTSFH